MRKRLVTGRQVWRRAQWFAGLLALLLLAGCEPQEAYTSTLIWGGSHRYREATLPGDLLLLAGSATLAETAALDGTAVLLGGDLQLDGRVAGDVTQLNGRLVVGPGAVIEGDLRHGGGTLVLAETAVVRGRQTATAGLALPEVKRASGWQGLVRALVAAVILAGAGSLLQRAAPAPVALVAHTATAHPLVSGALGLLVAFVAPMILVMMAFTLVLIPLAVALGLLLLLLAGYGQLSLGCAVGWRLRSRWAMSSQAAVFWGTVLLMGGLALLRLLPLLGDWLALIVWLTALGAVLLTRLGIRQYVPPQTTLFDDDLTSYARPPAGGRPTDAAQAASPRPTSGSQ